jgi:hypothetical protein
MPKIKYVDRAFNRSSLEIIETANAICESYRAQGLDLTVRQLYYRFVAGGLIANKDTEYKRLSSIVNDARLAGLIDWEIIVDRTRFLRTTPHWSSPRHIMQAVADQYALDKWEGQPRRPEVWIEKDALVGVIENVCRENDVPYFSCRGYTSQSEVWQAAMRLRGYARRGQRPVILHLGDHDPSGIDMTRDIDDRLTLFMGGVEVDRLALNMDQVDRYDPPPNPAKLTDARATGYIAEHGESSWELDALEPTVLSDLIRSAIRDLRDDDLWQKVEEKQALERTRLNAVATRWNRVVAAVEGTSLNDDGSVTVTVRGEEKMLSVAIVESALQEAAALIRALNSGADIGDHAMTFEDLLGLQEGGEDEDGDDE